MQFRELLNLDFEKVMQKAAENLRETMWFGVLEEMEKSYKMLSNILGVKVELSSHNMGNSRVKYKRPESEVSDEDKKLIKRLIPMDIWTYEYGLLLFEARWRFFRTGVYIEPEIPNFPKIDCKSTKYALRCESDPKVYYVRENRVKPETNSSLILKPNY